MNNVDFDVVGAAQAAARAHGVPTWVVAETIDHVHDEACYGTLEHADELLCGYEYADIPAVHCCDECDYNDAQEFAAGWHQKHPFDKTQRPSTNGGCS